MNEISKSIDARGLLCPLPVLKAAKAMRSMAKGEILQLISDDPASVIDVPHFCNEKGYDLCNSQTDALPYEYKIKK